MSLFNKNIPHDIEKDDQVDPQVESEPGAAADTAITTKLEYLKAKIESLEEQNKSTSERFISFNEQLGELRSSGFEMGKNMGELEAKSLKAVEIVNQIKPEEIFEVTQKSDFKIQQLSEKITALQLFTDTIMQDMKSMREDMTVFKDAKEILKLEKDVREQLISINKAKSVIEADTAKVESIFMDVQDQFNQSQRNTSLVNDMRRALENGLKEIENLKIKNVHLAEKVVLEQLSERLAKLETRPSYRALPLFALKSKDVESINSRLDLIEKEISENYHFTGRLLDELKGLGKLVSSKRKITPKQPKERRSARDALQMMKQMAGK